MVRGMGVKKWGAGLVAAALISAVTASGAPVVAAPAVLSVPFAPKTLKLSYDLPATLADKQVAETPRIAAPDKMTSRWACTLPIRIYYAAAPGVDARTVVKELAYPVEYLRDLGYTVQIVREVAYHADYRTPVTPGDVLLVVPLSQADAKVLRKNDWWAMTEPMEIGNVITSAKITVDGLGGLASDTLTHELGHVLGLDHKPGTVMNERVGAAIAFDPAETAAIDCR
jgi:hypothetical protein